MSDDLDRETTAGPVRGVRRGALLSWRGIPYAASPVGSLRFRAPEPPAPWSGPWDASRYGPVAPQPTSTLQGKQIDNPGQHESCLTLNVLTPSGAGPARPVMVWIHGGAYSTGSSATPLYRGERLVSAGNVVLVTINYRLGALGYLDFSRYSTSARWIESNLGLRDQVLALSWVRDNIAAFGGDPSRVTIFGESAGGNAVTTLMATPAAQGLFAQAIAQSPPPTSVYDATQTAHWAGAYARLLGGDPEDTPRVVSRLTTADPSELVTVTSTLSAAVPDQMPGSIALCPVVDGDYLPQHPVAAFADGSAARVPLLLGTNAREGTLFTKIPALDILPTTEQRIEKMFRLTDPAARERVLAVYPDYPGKSTLAEFGGDLAFLFPTLAVVAAHSALAPTWLYRFDSSTRLLDLLGVGATHATELPLVFGEVTVGLERLFTALGGGRARRALSERMMRHWSHFAHHGTPGPDWPPYLAPDRQTMVFDSTDRVRADLDRTKRLAWVGYREWRGVPPTD